VFTWHGSRRSAYRTGIAQILLLTQAVLTVIFCLVAIMPVWRMGPAPVVVVTMALVVALVVLCIWRAGQIHADPERGG